MDLVQFYNMDVIITIQIQSEGRVRNCLGGEVKVLISSVINIFMPTYLLLMHYKYINCTIEAASMFHFHIELDRGL